MKARLTKLSNNVNALRTSEVEGELLNTPEVGASLHMLGVGLTPEKPIRQVTTSVVQEIRVIAPMTYEIKTLNSLYRLEILELPQ